MPPTRPIAGYRTLYSKDPTTRELYAIGIAPPPSTFIADGVEPALLPVDFIWGDTSQVTPVGTAPFLIDQLGDVDTSTVAPVATQVLRFDGTQWTPGKAKIEDLADVDAYGASKAAGDVLTWDATANLWKAYPVTGGVSTTIPAVFEATWSGPMQFRAPSSSVTLQMDAVKSSSAWTGAPATFTKICAYPAGVTAPFATLTVQVMLVTDPVALNLSTRPVMVQARADGIYMQLYAGAAAFDTVANDLIYATLNWTV